MGYLQFLALGKVLEGGDAIDADGYNFEVWHPLDEGEVFELVAPQVQVFDALQVVGFCLVEDQFLREHFALASAHAG
jgi:hypothetical protein